VKASDYLRLWYLYNNGGIYIDAATDVLKPFSLEMISSHLFVCRETNGFVANGIIGVEQGHPLLKKVMDLMETLDGKNDAVFQNGMAIWNRQLDLYYENSWGFDEKGVMIAKNDPRLVRIYPPEYFLPYNHETGQVNITKNSCTIHHYLKSWQK
jgi:hypothetical protein